jgi:hypothetical protein
MGLQGTGGMSVSDSGTITGSYLDANSVLHGFVIAPAQATVTVMPASPSITTAQALAVTVAVSGGTGNPTPTGSVTLTSGTYTAAPTALSSGSATINIPAGSLATGADTLAVSYTGDSNYGAANGSGAVTVTAAAAPGFTIKGTAVAVNPGAPTGNSSTVTITPFGGFTGNVALTAAVTSSPNGAQDIPTLSFGSTSPVSITGATAGTATLTVSTTAASSSALTWPERSGTRWYTGGGAVFACVLLIGIPAQRRSWRTMAVFVGSFVVLAGGMVACKLGTPNNINGNAGTSAGAYTVKVTATSGAITQTGTLTVTVQ